MGALYDTEAEIRAMLVYLLHANVYEGQSGESAGPNVMLFPLPSDHFCSMCTASEARSSIFEKPESWKNRKNNYLADVTLYWSIRKYSLSSQYCNFFVRQILFVMFNNYCFEEKKWKKTIRYSIISRLESLKILTIIDLESPFICNAINSAREMWFCTLNRFMEHLDAQSQRWVAKVWMEKNKLKSSTVRRDWYIERRRKRENGRMRSVHRVERRSQLLEESKSGSCRR